jgi:hypothetical protein
MKNVFSSNNYSPISFFTLHSSIKRTLPITDADGLFNFHSISDHKNRSKADSSPEKMKSNSQIPKSILRHFANSYIHTVCTKKFWPSLSVNSKKKKCNPYFIVIMITVLIIYVIFWVVNFKPRNYFVISTTQNDYLRLSMYDCSNFVYS